MPITNIHDDEWEDCEYALAQRKRSKAEFDFIETVQPMVGTGIQALQSRLVVRNRKSGEQREYQPGFMSAWTVEFARDLDARLL